MHDRDRVRVRVAIVRATAFCALASFMAAGCVMHLHRSSERADRDRYVPGLGEIMAATQMRHLKLWYAGRAGNWALADYELDELEEGFADAMRFHREHKDSPRPLTELIPEFTRGASQALRAAIHDENPSEFEAAYDGLTEGCNGCHAASLFSFNRVVRPRANPYSNQEFADQR